MKQDIIDGLRDLLLSGAWGRAFCDLVSVQLRVVVTKRQKNACVQASACIRGECRMQIELLATTSSSLFAQTETSSGLYVIAVFFRRPPLPFPEGPKAAFLCRRQVLPCLFRLELARSPDVFKICFFSDRLN